MPLSTRIVRDGKPLSIHWGSFHIVAMAIAATLDMPEARTKFEAALREDIPGYQYPAVIDLTPNMVNQCMFFGYTFLAQTPLNNGTVVLNGNYRFRDTVDGEVLDLLAGDTLVAYRDW